MDSILCFHRAAHLPQERDSVVVRNSGAFTPAPRFP